jgi:hypothetical protein
MVLLAMAAVMLLPLAANAVMYGFSNITNNNAGDAAIGEAQLFVDVTASGTGVLFTFGNTGPAASSITDVYFDDGTLLALTTIFNGPGVIFSQGASPGNLPGGNTVTPPFVTTAGFSADSNPPAQPNGVNPGESLGIFFTLQGTSDFDSVLAALGLGGATGGLRIGIHVQGFDSGGSESFINNPREGFPNPIPVPPTVWLMGSGLVGLGLLRWRRRQQ